MKGLKKQSAAGPVALLVLMAVADPVRAGETKEVAAAQAALPPLIIAELAKQSHGADYSEDVLRAAVHSQPNPELRLDFSAVLPIAQADYAVAYSECDPKLCRGYVATLHSDEAAGGPHLRLTRKQELPAPAKLFLANGMQIQAIALADVNGDGRPELLLDYMALEPPRPALGSLAHQYYAIYSLPQLTPAWNFEVHRSGGAAEPTCDYDIAYGQLAQKSGGALPGLMAKGNCQPSPYVHPELPKAPPIIKRFIWSKAAQRFIALTN